MNFQSICFPLLSAVLTLACLSGRTTGQTTGQNTTDSASAPRANTPPPSPSQTWWQWRGKDNSGAVAGTGYPVEFDAKKNVLWKIQLPGKGCSTPIYCESTIYLTAPLEGEDAVCAYGLDGKKKWTTSLGKQQPGKHRNGSGCNSSPVTDGQSVFAYFKSGTLAAVDLDGNVVWKKNLVKQFGKSTLYWDHGASPVLTDDHVIVTRMHTGMSWLAAFDKSNGELVWKVDRNYETAVEGDHGYTTPVVFNFQNQPAILLWGAEHLTVHDARSGKLMWEMGGFNPEKQAFWPTVASPVLVGTTAVIASGRNDKRKPLLYGVDLSAVGGNVESENQWKRVDTGTFVPTPAVKDGLVYLVRDRGEVECFDPTTGQAIWRGQLPKSRKLYYSSPLVTGDCLYAVREDGLISVISTQGKQFKVLASNNMNESVIASLVPLPGKQLLIRGIKHLFCITP